MTLVIDSTNRKSSSPKPVQAGDYGKSISETDKNNDKAESADTDGRKVLSLWSH